MPKTAIRIGPLDHGRRMSLKEFDHAEGQEGYLYELSRGIIIVSDVPKRKHLLQVHGIREQFYSYSAMHPGRIYAIATGSESKILIPKLETERHADLSIYLTAPANDTKLWARWIPEIVIEVISPGSEFRDYEEKREDYFAFGVIEYWIFDAIKGEMLVLRRSRGGWKEQTIRPPEIYRTRLLPGFKFDCGRVFEAAKDID